MKKSRNIFSLVLLIALRFAMVAALAVVLTSALPAMAQEASGGGHLFANPANALLVIPGKSRQILPLNEKLLKFVSDTLHLGKPGLNLDCDVKVREMTDEVKFSDGVRRIATIEIIYKTSHMNYPEVKAYFPVGSEVTKEVKVSKFAGTVEEIQLQSDDLANSRFIFQHNGRGEIVWMSFEDDQTTVPCALKR